MIDWNPRANELFLNALDIASPAERQAYLESACGDDNALRQAVEGLLRSHEAAGGLLESSGAAAGRETDPAAPAAVQEDLPGAVLAGRYKLLQQIGEGGMGTVWMAEQVEPVRRLVAVKLIKPGMDSALVIARFEAERQALALMDHPNIARVLDAGSTDTPLSPGSRVPRAGHGERGEGPGLRGRPWFVMELVKGIPITRYCDENQLTLRERLALMAQASQAVQHAHQKGVIHRDLKPSNVLVAVYDGKPVPKVIDFGIAKAVGHRLTDKTLFTGFGSILGTLEYMSPEQAELNALDVDTRADVYSLGVLLYELLTGTTPLTRQRLEKSALLEVLRVIREQDPPPPSSRLSESKETLAAVSAQRRMEPKRLSREVRGELDWIVMKALEKDRGRRYETANALTRDIERYLHNEAVEAGPPSTAYRMRKFVARHRALVLGTVLVVLTLLSGVAGTTWGLLRALAAEQTAQEESSRADEEKKAAEIEKSRALAAEADTRAFSDFLLFQVLLAARRESEAQKVPITSTIVPSIVESEKSLAARFKDKPTAEADVRHALGVTWRNRKMFDAAQRNFRRALELRSRYLGENAAQTLSSQRCLGASLDEAGRPREGLPLLEDVLKRLRAAPGDTAGELLLALDNLGAAYGRANRLSEALALQKEALERGKKIEPPDSPEMFRRMGRLGSTYTKMNQPRLAAPLLEAAFKGMKSRDVSQPETLECLQSLAISYAETSRMVELTQLMIDYFEAAPPVRGKDDDYFVSAGYLLLTKKQFGPAEVFLRQGLKMLLQRKALDWQIASVRALLGAALLGQKQYQAAEPFLLQAYEGLRGDDYLAFRIEVMEWLVRLYDASGKKDQADGWRKKLAQEKAAEKKP